MCLPRAFSGEASLHPVRAEFAEISPWQFYFLVIKLLALIGSTSLQFIMKNCHFYALVWAVSRTSSALPWMWR